MFARDMLINMGRQAGKRTASVDIRAFFYADSMLHERKRAAFAADCSE